MNQSWKIGLIFTLLLAVGLFLSATAQTSPQLVGKFTGTVRLGPNAGLVFQGNLTLSLGAGGAVKGTLVRPDGPPIAVTGTVVGQAITWVFDLGGGRYIFGTGGLNRDIRQKPSTVGGTLSGPSEGDIGDWGWGIGG
jgi:hypothetical protein